jgi:hypothetical protein
MQQAKDLFTASSALILNLVVKNNSFKKDHPMKKSANKYLDALTNKVFTNDDVATMIKKVYNVVTPNMKLLNEKNPDLFKLSTTNKDGKNVRIALLPGIDFDLLNLSLSSDEKNKLWTYTQTLYYSSAKMLALANPDGVPDELKKYIEEMKIIDNTIFKEFYEVYPNSTFFVKKYDTNDDSMQTYGLDDLKNTADLAEKFNGEMGIENLIKLLGFDFSKIGDQLKEMKQEDIMSATENLKKIFGNDDSDTGDMITEMIKNITEEIKNTESKSLSSVDSFMKIADTVAKKMIPNIDKKKAEKMIESTKKMATDSSNPMNFVAKMLGNNAMGGNMNPSQMMNSMMTTIKQSQSEACLDLIKKEGINVGNLDITKLNINKINKMLESATKEVQKK